MSNLKNSVYAAIDALASSEKITREVLANISRELLMYVPDSQDIDAVNRLIGVLTPVNKKMAIMFFSHFLPWIVEKTPEGDFQRFGKKFEGDKKIARRMTLIDTFLKDTTNTIWTWSKVNVSVEPSQKDFARLIQNNVKNALKGDQKTNTPPLNPALVMDAVFSGGIGVAELINALERAKARIDEATKNHPETIDAIAADTCDH